MDSATKIDAGFRRTDGFRCGVPFSGQCGERMDSDAGFPSPVSAASGWLPECGNPRMRTSGAGCGCGMRKSKGAEFRCGMRSCSGAGCGVVPVRDAEFRCGKMRSFSPPRDAELFRCGIRTSGAGKCGVFPPPAMRKCKLRECACA